MTPQQIEAMKLALEALKWCHGGEPCGTSEAITAIEDALADHAMQEVQRLGQEIEPDDIASILACRDMLDAQPVPPRTWVGLTDEEMFEAIRMMIAVDDSEDEYRAIEAAHGIKENT